MTYLTSDILETLNSLLVVGAGGAATEPEVVQLRLSELPLLWAQEPTLLSQPDPGVRTKGADDEQELHHQRNVEESSQLELIKLLSNIGTQL